MPMIPPAPIQVPKRRMNHKRKNANSAPTPSLTLVAAVYNSDSSFVDLTFDVAIDIDAMDCEKIFVDDGMTMGFVYQGITGPELINPTTVRVLLNGIDESTASDIRLTVQAGNDIVPTGGGAEWAGVTGLVLPFP
jgi:hypothetical protein